MAELAGAIGMEAARELARQFGGTTISVPREIGQDHPLRARLGEELCRRLAEWYGGTRIGVPKGPERRTQVKELRQAGALTVAGIALETGYSERQVYRILAESDDRQLDLFGN